MNFKEQKQTLLQMQKEYMEFFKAFVSIETGIEDEKILEDAYYKFMKNDDLELLNDDIKKLVE